MIRGLSAGWRDVGAFEELQLPLFELNLRISQVSYRESFEQLNHRDLLLET
jgi:hypothetical protein